MRRDETVASGSSSDIFKVFFGILGTLGLELAWNTWPLMKGEEGIISGGGVLMFW